jgi:predicted membrane-bound spermidine synthase
LPKEISRTRLIFGAPVWLLALLVFASGGSALVFQVAWMRELRLVFGATTAAVAAVLAIFMAGLGIGSAVLGKRADRVRDPLRFYGALELAIAISVAVSPWLVDFVRATYYRLGGQESLGVTGATFVRLVLSGAVIAVPTVLMGGTLPAAVRSVTHAADVNRRTLGLLYGANTLGAVCGAALATFFTLERLGTRTTLWAGCAISMLVGFIAISRARADTKPRVREERSTYKAARRALIEIPAMDGDGEAQPVRPGLIYLAAALLGFTFFALELVWYRMLAPILGGTAFTFGLILCVALLGIGVGGILYSVVFRWFRPTGSALAITCGLEAALTIIPYALGDRIALLAAWRADAAAGFTQLVIAWSHVACIVVLPVALVSGLQFPLLTSLLGRGQAAVGKHLGMTYAWNTVGAIAGSLVAGFGALPLLSATGLWQLIAAVLAILSLFILIGARPIDRRSAVVVGALSLATVAAMFATGPTAAWRHSGIGAGRTEAPMSNANRIRQWVFERRRSLQWETDGIESSIGLVVGDGTNFFVNGKSDGNSLRDAPTQIGVAALAAVLHREPQTALVIGLGTGETAGWLAQMRNIQQVDVVELEPAIDEMAFRCRELNWNVLEHPRVRRIYNDGREFVLASDNQYDVIVSEPSNPYRAGVAVLYTAEFYKAVSERLKKGGLFIQWLQAYEVEETTVHTVLATARGAFPHVEIWQTLPGDLQLICSAGPLELEIDELRARIEDPSVKDALVKVWYVDGIEGFLAHFVASARWADEIAARPQIPRNTDDRTLLEYGFAKTVGSSTPFSIEQTRGRLRAAGFDRPNLRGGTMDWNRIELQRQEFNLIFSGHLSIALLPRAADRAVVKAFEAYNQNRFADAIAIWPADHLRPSTNIQRLVLARSYAELARPECLKLIVAAADRFPTDAAAVRAIYYCRAMRMPEAAEALDEFYSRLANSPWVMPVISETALSRTVDVARFDPSTAERLEARLSQPFASRRFEHLRILARFFVAEVLGPDRVVEALKEMEPYVIWTKEILEPRAKAYAAVRHPLAAQAARDWQWHQRHQQAR